MEKNTSTFEKKEEFLQYKFRDQLQEREAFILTYY